MNYVNPIESLICLLPWQKHDPTCIKIPTPIATESLFAKRNPLWKRGFDLFASLCGIIFLSPLLLTIAIFILTVSPGPILFKQKRVGRGGKLFTLLKFRTMHLNADTSIHKDYLQKLISSGQGGTDPGDPMKKLTNDTRIIKYGNLLRSSGLDELPQLINVLMGRMSLVGPRPPIPYEVREYPPWYSARFDVLPGLTGLWQVSGKNKLGFNEMIRLDIQYAMKRSLLLDLKILMKTPYAVLGQVIELLQKRSTIQLKPYTDRR